MAVIIHGTTDINTLTIRRVKIDGVNVPLDSDIRVFTTGKHTPYGVSLHGPTEMLSIDIACNLASDVIVEWTEE